MEVTLVSQRSATELRSRKLALARGAPSMPDLSYASRASSLQSCAALCTPLVQFAAIYSRHSRVVHSVVYHEASIGFQLLIRVEQAIGANWREQCHTVAKGRRIGLNDWKKTALVYSLTGRVADIFDVAAVTRFRVKVCLPPR